MAWQSRHLLRELRHWFGWSSRTAAFEKTLVGPILKKRIVGIDLPRFIRDFGSHGASYVDVGEGDTSV